MTLTIYRVIVNPHLIIVSVASSHLEQRKQPQYDFFKPSRIVPLYRGTDGTDEYTGIPLFRLMTMYTNIPLYTAIPNLRFP